MRQLKIQKSILNTENLSKYLMELNSKVPLTPEEEVELTLKIKKGDRKALNRIVEANLRFVVSVAKQYNYATVGTCITLEDLIQEGNIGLIKAAERFDETKGFKFISYAVWWIRQQIQKYVSENFNPVSSIPLNVNGIKTKVDRINERFQQEYQRNATEYELAEEFEGTGLKNAFLGLMERGGIPRKSFSLQDKVETEGGNSTFENLLPSEDKNEVEVLTGMKRRDLIKEVLLSSVKRRTSAAIDNKIRSINVFFDTIGLNETGTVKSLDDIATELDLSKERCRQLVKNITMELKRKAKEGKITIDDLGL